MAGHSSFDEEDVLFGEDFDDFEVAYFDALIAHSAGHTEAFDHSRWEGGGTDRAGMALAVVLAVGGIADSAEAVSFHYPLKALSLGGTDDVYRIAFIKHICNGNRITELDGYGEVAEFDELSLGGGSRLFKMAEERFGGVFFLSLAKAELDGVVLVGFDGFDLCHDIGLGEYDGTGHLLAVTVIDTGHPEFFTYESVHFSTILYNQKPQYTTRQADRALCELHLDFDTAGQFQFRECFDGVGFGRVDFDEALMGPKLELLARFFVDVWRAQDGEDLLFCRQRNRTHDMYLRLARGVDDLFRGFVDEVVVVRAEFDANFLIHACVILDVRR